MMSDVFVTGGTGFLGGELTRQLVEAGYRVRMLSRKAEPATGPPGVEAVRGDLSDVERLAEQMSGCDTVFHAAALVASWVRDPKEFYRTNVDGLLNIQEASRRSGVKTVVYTSSFFALGPAKLPGANEDAPLPDRHRHGYEHSKSLARKIARDSLKSGFPMIILYPGVIYGPGRRTEGNLVARMLCDFQSGRLPGLLGDGSQVWSYSYVEDVARGHLLALKRAASGGEFVLGGDNVSHRDFFALASRLTGRPAPRLKIPAWLGSIVAAGEIGVSRLLGRQPSMTPATVRMMYDHWALDSTRARDRLGYNSRSLESGMRETLRSLGISPAAGEA